MARKVPTFTRARRTAPTLPTIRIAPTQVQEAEIVEEGVRYCQWAPERFAHSPERAGCFRLDQAALRLRAPSYDRETGEVRFEQPEVLMRQALS